MRLGIVVVLTALLFPAAAHATLTINAPDPRYSKVLDKVGRMPAPDGTVERKLTPCSLGQDCVTWDAQNTVTLWAPPGANLLIFYHELGHVFDRLALSDLERYAYMLLNGERGPWYQGPGKPSPMERFAEAYSFCASGIRRWSPYDYAPGHSQHVANCVLIRRMK